MVYFYSLRLLILLDIQAPTIYTLYIETNNLFIASIQQIELLSYQRKMIAECLKSKN